jgi:hypothetical protein
MGLKTVTWGFKKIVVMVQDVLHDFGHVASLCPRVCAALVMAYHGF